MSQQERLRHAGACRVARSDGIIQPVSFRVMAARERECLPLGCALAVSLILGVLVSRSSCAAMRTPSRRARVPTQVPELRDFVQLQRLELSYNELRSLAPLSALASPALEELFAASNKLPCIEARLRMEWRSVAHCASCINSERHHICTDIVTHSSACH